VILPGCMLATEGRSLHWSEHRRTRWSYGRQAWVCGVVEPPTTRPFLRMIGPIDDAPCKHWCDG
jgi:hypothetical protein